MSESALSVNTLITKLGHELAVWRGDQIPSELKKLIPRIKSQGGKVVVCRT